MKKDNYSDIINLPHYVSKKRPRMSIEQRSAQFAPFAALTGYEDEIEEAGREFVKRWMKNKRSSFVTTSFLVARSGIEPLTRGFSVPCSTN